MQPKLIILNGPLGIGKTTLAKRYGEEHQLTLVLDIDDIRSMLSHWRERKNDSGPLSMQIALAMARTNLSAGHDVIVPQILQTVKLAESLEQLAQDCKAEYYEVLLVTSKE